MRVVVAGQGWLATRAAVLMDALVRHALPGSRLEVVPTTRDHGEDAWMPSLLKRAQLRGWPAHDRVEASGLGSEDVLISLQYDRIIDCDQLGGARAYNVHFAPLPRYRGSLTSALTVRNGERTTAVTLHELVAEVDAGAIIAAQPFEVPPFYTTFDLYTAYHRYGFELLRNNALGLLLGTVTSTPQDEAGATLFKRGAIDFGDAALERFDLPVEQVRDWCRSLIFPPTQYPTFRGRPIASCYAMEFTGDPLAAGTVIHESGDFVLAACSDGVLALELLTP